MSAVKIADNVYWVGVKDRDLRVFDIIMPTRYGTTYNAYLVKGEKVALIDTVKKGFTEEYLANIEEITPLSAIDYLVVNHTEPDHSGSIIELLKRAPNIQIVCALAAKIFVQNVLNSDNNLTGLKDNAFIELGGKTLTIKLTPYMHWPDTMMEYLAEDKVLFSGDGFAAHYAGDAIYGDELPGEIDLDHEVHYYFDTIMRPFTSHIRKNLVKLEELDIKMVAPSHGPLFRNQANRYINMYKDWSVDKAEGKNQVAIFYASSYGNTKIIAERISTNLNRAGFLTPVNDITACDKMKARELIEESKAVIIGTPTFNGDAVKPVWDFVNLFSTVDAKGKKAATFGSYGWSGEGTKLVSDRLAGMKIKVMPEPFRAKLVPSEKELSEVDRFSGEIANFINEG
ncbi:MAG: FprA family A-type flavoprotein [candidate division Zixibacteria bacterium]|nr:FprA family A-type flavoprotein [candidate division Zixibacteria bacterium]